MDAQLVGLRSAPGEGAIRGGERQAFAALRLAFRAPTVRRVVALETAVVSALWVGLLLLRRRSGPFDGEPRLILASWVAWLAASLLATGCSAAVVFAVDARIDGIASDLRLAFGEVRSRLPALLVWWLISTAALVAVSLGLKTVTRPLLAFLAVLAIWGLGTLFVVPVIALRGRGPLTGIAEALRLLRARWGRALVGLLVIGFLFGLAFLVPGGLVRAASGDPHRTTGEELWRFGAPLALFYLLWAAMAATRGGLAVILARDALGDLPGEPPRPETTPACRGDRQEGRAGGSRLGAQPVRLRRALRRPPLAHPVSGAVRAAAGRRSGPRSLRGRRTRGRCCNHRCDEKHHEDTSPIPSNASSAWDLRRRRSHAATRAVGTTTVSSTSPVTGSAAGSRCWKGAGRGSAT